MSQAVELRIPAELHKLDVGVYALMRGCTNRGAVTLAGVTYEPDRLRFLSFFGKWNLERQLLVGEYRFHVGKFPDGELANLETLPNLLNDPQPVVAEAATDVPVEVTDDEETESAEATDGV